MVGSIILKSQFKIYRLTLKFVRANFKAGAHCTYLYDSVQQSIHRKVALEVNNELITKDYEMTHLNSGGQHAPNTKTYSDSYLIGYLIKHKYLAVNSNDAEYVVFFNPRKSQYLRFPSEQKTFTAMQIKTLFACGAMDYPVKGEWLRFKLFKYISRFA